MIHTIHKKYRLFVVVLALLLSVSVPVGVFSDFIIDENNKKTLGDGDNNRTKLPPHIAYNIQSEKVTDIANAIKISWNVSSEYQKQFILGRATEVIDNKERALKAYSVRILPAKADNVYIDADLKPGKYYYVILAKENVTTREIELYRDVNYTSMPVLIEESLDNLRKLNKMQAKDLADGRVLVTWKRLNMLDVVYTIYRAKYMLDTVDKVRAATAIGSVVDKDEFIDSVLPGDGKYFYAYTTTIKGQDEIISLVPDKTFITEGVQIFSRGSYFGVTNIKARVMKDDINITWERASERKLGIKGYAVYRHDKMIHNSGRLSEARHIVTVDSGTNSYLDRHPEKGVYFYAVLTKFNDSKVDMSLRRDFNFTTTSVIIGENYILRTVEAKKVKRGILVLWDYTGNMGDKKFRLFRTSRKLYRLRDVNERLVIQEVNITERGYLDLSPSRGIFYYGIVPLESSENMNLRLIRGVNITKYPLQIKADGSVVRKDEVPDNNKRKDYNNPDDYALGSLEKILRRTYYKSEYKYAIKELKGLVKTSDNQKEKARAKLFIGKSYVELGLYKQALNYFILSDVVKYFPEESKFWHEFAIRRIR